MLSKLLIDIPKEDHEIVEADFKSAFQFRKRMTEVLKKDIMSEFESTLLEDKSPENIAESLAKIKAWKKVLNILK